MYFVIHTILIAFLSLHMLTADTPSLIISLGYTFVLGIGGIAELISTD